MVLPESVSMTDSDQSDALLFHVSIEVALNIHTDCTGALVKNGVLWLVIDQATHGHSLLFTTTEHVIPVVASVPASFTVNEVAETDLTQKGEQVIIRDTSCLLILWCVWINQLISKGTVWKVRSLRNIENLVNWWFVELTTVNWPELSHDSEKRTLSASVWTGDQKVHARADLEVHFIDEDIAIWGQDWHIYELEII